MKHDKLIEFCVVILVICHVIIGMPYRPTYIRMTTKGILITDRARFVSSSEDDVKPKDEHTIGDRDFIFTTYFITMSFFCIFGGRYN